MLLKTDLHVVFGLSYIQFLATQASDGIDYIVSFKINAFPYRYPPSQNIYFPRKRSGGSAVVLPGIVTVCGGVGPKRRRVGRSFKQKGFLLETDGVHTGQRVMPRQRLDTKQEPKYTETNETQVDTMKLTTTERDR